MDDSEENISTGELSPIDSPVNCRAKPKKRSLVERELETNLTDRVTSPITNGVTSTSRYGRARKLKTSSDFCDTEQAVANVLKSPKSLINKSPAYKMHALNSPIKLESPKLISPDSNIENKIKSIYHENISLSRFAGDEKKLTSPSKKTNKIYVRKDLIQNQEKEETLNLIRNMFSPPKSSSKSSSHLNNILERSSDKYSLNIPICNSEKKKAVNNHVNNASVVKILDFDNSKKKKRDSKEGEKGKVMSKSELFEMEAKCDYQVGDLAWARMGTFPFWPCIVTREPSTGFFVKKKLFGRVERDIIHVTFFGDNGRRSWIVDNMLRKYLGKLEFENTRDQFTAEAKKKDPKLYSAFFISEKKQPSWKHSVEEAEQLLREPKRLRIDIFNNMLLNYRQVKNHRSEKVSRTNSDVSLSESLYDTLFSEDDGKNEDSTERNRNKTKNKSLDVSEVVTACLDNMAAKTGITKIQRQSHMDRWLQKAKSKTPEKAQDQPINGLSDKKSSSKNKKLSNHVQKDGLRNSKSRNKSSTLLAHEHNYSSQPPVSLEREYDQSSDDSNLKFENGLTETSNSECSNNQVDENILLSTDAIISDLVADSLKNNNFEKIIELPVTNGLPDNIMEDDDQMVVDEALNNEENATKLNVETSHDLVSNNISDNDTYKESQTFTEDIDDAFDLRVDNTDGTKADDEVHNPTTNVDESPNDVSMNEVDENNMETEKVHSNQTDKDDDVALIPSDNKESNLDDMNSLDNITSINDKECVQNNDTPSLDNSFSTDCSDITENDKELESKKSELLKKDHSQSDIDETDSSSPVKNNTSLDFKMPDINPVNIVEKVKDLSSTSISETDNVEPTQMKEENLNSTVTNDTEKNVESIVSDKIDTRSRTLEVRLEKMPIDIHLQFSDNNKANFEVKDEEKTQEIFKENSETNKENHGDLVPDSDNEPKEKPILDQDNNPFVKIKTEINPETASIHSETSEASNSSRRSRKSDKSNERKFSKSNIEKALKNPEFVQYLEFKQDAVIEENPELTQEDIVLYLYNTWIYEESLKDDTEKADDIVQANLVKGLKTETAIPQKKIRKKKEKVEKLEREISPIFEDEIIPKDKPKRKTVKQYYNEEYDDVDLEDEIQLFEIFRKKKTNSQTGTKKVEIKEEDIKTEPSTSTSDGIKTENPKPTITNDEVFDVDEYDEVETYFEQLLEQKPNIFKGLIRDKVCEICETTGTLVRCKGCYGHFHVDCVKKQSHVVEVSVPSRGRKKKKKSRGRKPKGYDETNGFDESHSDEKDANGSEENPDVSMEETPQSHTVDAENFEAQLETKMKEILDNAEVIYDSSSDDEVTWINTIPGKCEIVDVKPKVKQEFSDQTDFKCNDCETNETPLCFVCKSTTSKGQVIRQKCSVAHCNKYYHLSCLEHWPQTQFNSGNHTKTKQTNEHFETITCPRHVCHTCVSDDPRGCKTRFSGDKLARCLRCPATYHTFTKCLPAGSQILTGSHIICPRHYQHRPGKVPCHVNTGWCFICALGGSLICCEYCPTSFHAECLNIDPPEGGYMCEDCETGRLPLYGEMVWVKLGHYRWWPGLILHPSEIPDNIMAVKHSLGEFVVRFFGQYDHYWVNRGRVFPFQEGDSGKVSSQKSKIDEAFTMAMQHAQRAYEIMKSAQPNEEESIDIASSLLPPHYVKLRVNKPVGSLVGRRVDDETDSTTQCDCDPNEPKPCAPYTHCLNRMLLTECGPWCKAGDRCQNRAFERREYPKLTPYRTPHRGWGLKTLEYIRQGQFVIEYVGELIDEEEFRRRMTRKHEMRDENFYFLTLDKERMIDAGPKGNLARFMNHSCEPNCETQKWTVLGDVRVGLFALVDIPANSEVNFNYNLECAGIDKKRCMCGAKRCSGYMGAKPKQEEPQPKKNKMRPAKRTYKKRKPIEISPSTSAVKKSPKPRLTTRSKPRELTEIEKDLLIIKNATNGISSDSESDRISLEDKSKKPLKRKRVSFSTEEVIFYNDATESPSIKKLKVDCEKNGVLGD